MKVILIALVLLTGCAELIKGAPYARGYEDGIRNCNLELMPEYYNKEDVERYKQGMSAGCINK